MISIKVNNPIFKELVLGDTYITNDGLQVTLENCGSMSNSVYYLKPELQHLKRLMFKTEGAYDVHHPVHPLVALFYDENLTLTHLLIAGTSSYFVEATQNEIKSKEIVGKIPNIVEKIQLL